MARSQEVDLDNGKITLKHGDIKNLDITRNDHGLYKSRDKDQLTNLKPGDKVQFMVVQRREMITTDIQPVR